MQKIFLPGIAVLVCLFLSACAEPFDRRWLEKKYSDETSRFMTLDGNRVHYRDEGQTPGSADKEVIVLVHGTASSLHTWDAWASRLVKHYRVIRMDLPGFGLTGPDRSDRYEVADDVKFLLSFLQQLGLEQVHLAGSSLGGRISWQLALEHSEKVKSLTLMNALGYPQASWPPAIAMAQWPVFDTVMAHVSPRFMYAFGLKDVYFDPSRVDEALVDRYFELSRYPGNLAAFPKRVKARLDKDASRIAELKVPTLILWGEEDHYFPVENAYRFHADIEHSVVRVYPKTGHLPMEERPQASVAHFIEFISQLSSEFSLVCRRGLCASGVASLQTSAQRRIRF